MQNRSIVVLIPCADYDEERVYEAVRKGIDLLGGISSFVRRDESLLLKPNLLLKALPQRAVTTHPAVFGAVCRILHEEGYTDVKCGDSPGSPVTSAFSALEGCGLLSQAEKYGIAPADMSSAVAYSFPDGTRAKKFEFCKGVMQADAIINVCKMKTHALERITGAVKNLYGCIFAANKATGHAHYPGSAVFAEMLADIHACLRPRLHIMDGIIAMEGNGPTSGTPVQMGVLLFSADPVALDTVFSRLVYVDPADVPTNVAGAARGIGTMDECRITVRTPDGDLTAAEAAKRFGKPDFKVVRGSMKKGILGMVLPLLPFLQERPQVDRSKCVGCGICEQACPVPEKAIKAGKGKKAVYDRKRCIRCFCCQEMCPQKAISARRGF